MWNYFYIKDQEPSSKLVNPSWAAFRVTHTPSMYCNFPGSFINANTKFWISSMLQWKWKSMLDSLWNYWWDKIVITLESYMEILCLSMFLDDEPLLFWNTFIWFIIFVSRTEKCRYKYRLPTLMYIETPHGRIYTRLIGNKIMFVTNSKLCNVQSVWDWFCEFCRGSLEERKRYLFRSNPYSVVSAIFF